MLSPIDCINYFVNQPVWITGGDDTQYYIEKKGNEVIIAFAPSNSKRDWINNFRFWKTPYKDMEVKYYCHAGFLDCWKKIRHEVEDAVRALNPKQITVTGYSYGGAIATLCKEDMWYCFPDIREDIQAITFGAPRVIGFYNWKKIKERWNNTRLIKNSADIVTCVPLIVMFYHHVASLICIGEKVRFWKYFKPQKYHSIHEYKKSIEDILK